MSNLKDKIANMPASPGVYLMKDKAGRILYIGKAKSLKKRLSSYLGRDLSTKTIALMSKVEDIKYRLCPTESMALLLEASLVHEYKPRYNVSLRDDKSFPWVKITNEEFPAIYITRKKEPDGARYLGPFISAKLLKQALRIIRRRFPYRSCKKLPKQACIYYRLNLSPAPCIGKINKKDYARTMEDISLILEGKTDALVKKLTEAMNLKSKATDFEAAAKIRDQINALSAIGQAARSGLSKEAESEDLKNLLGLHKKPERIEAFDISNLFGKEATGSMVSFYRGLPDKDNYRRFRIKTVEGINDYSMLDEVLRRRYRRVIEEGLRQPDLVLIDGGRQHLMVAQRALKDLGLEIPLASIAKEREHIYIQGRATPIKLENDTPGLNLIRRIRDEAHRFAVTYHHLLRRKKIIGR
jgi:excinuclease ABC subunit C